MEKVGEIRGTNLLKTNLFFLVLTQKEKGMAGRERKLIKLNDETGAAPGRAVAVEEEKGEGGEDSVIAELPERPRRQRRRRAGQRPPEGLMVPIIN